MSADHLTEKNVEQIVHTFLYSARKVHAEITQMENTPSAETALQKHLLSILAGTLSQAGVAIGKTKKKPTTLAEIESALATAATAAVEDYIKKTGFRTLLRDFSNGLTLVPEDQREEELSDAIRRVAQEQYIPEIMEDISIILDPQKRSVELKQLLREQPSPQKAKKPLDRNGIQTLIKELNQVRIILENPMDSSVADVFSVTSGNTGALVSPILATAIEKIVGVLEKKTSLRRKEFEGIVARMIPEICADYLPANPQREKSIANALRRTSSHEDITSLLGEKPPSLSDDRYLAVYASLATALSGIPPTFDRVASRQRTSHRSP